MEQNEGLSPFQEAAVKREIRNSQLLRVWQDYYDELYEVDLKSGAFESLTDNREHGMSKSGFVEIEVILLAERSVHPDDRESFKKFFDSEQIRNCVNAGIYVTKLNFRLRGKKDGEYIWIKVKNIVPTKWIPGQEIYFSCFRRVDRETGDDLRYKQELSDALASARDLNERRNRLLNRIFREIKSPLNGIIGMAGLLKSDIREDNPDLIKLADRIDKLEAEALTMNKVLNQLYCSNIVDKDEKAGVQFVDHPVNKISYSLPKEDQAAEKEPDIVLPQDYAYLTEIDKSGVEETGKESFDFSGRRFLVVEDNELNLEVMKELLESTGAVVDTAIDGKQAVVSFVSKPAGTYDVILMDIDIPVIDGYSATRCIRIAGKDDSKLVPIYAVTSNNFEEEVKKTYEYGFNAFFIKPVDFSLLFEKIGKELGC